MFSTGVPTCDRAVEVFADDSILGRFYNGSKCGSSHFRLLSFSDIRGDSTDGVNLARRVTQGELRSQPRYCAARKFALFLEVQCPARFNHLAIVVLMPVGVRLWHEVVAAFADHLGRRGVEQFGDGSIGQHKPLFQIEGIDNGRRVINDALDLLVRRSQRILGLFTFGDVADNTDQYALAIDCCPARTYLYRECGSILAAMESLKEYAVPVSLVHLGGCHLPGFLSTKIVDRQAKKHIVIIAV